jgi:ubiquinone/menaquinone biosynthesis C-methylase UbiE
MKPSYYGPLRAQGYDIGTDVSEIMAFYVDHWKRLGRPAPLIELMCGTGLNMVWYLREGAECDGLDASGHMLDVCRRRLDELGFQSNLYEQDLESMNLSRRYEFMFIPGGSFGHIYDKSIALDCLCRMHEQLKPGGWLVLDVRPPAYMTHFGKDDEVDYDLDEYEDGATIFTAGYWQHIEQGRVIRKWNKKERFVNDVLQETEVFDYRERMYEETELRGMLEQAGFNEIQVTKAYEQDTMPSEGDGIVFTSRKA